jgi:chromosome segregation ATPase
MSNEEFERQMEFILRQQANFEANLEKQHQQSTEDWAKQRERNGEVDRQIEQLVASLSILRDAIIGLTHHVEGHQDHLERNEDHLERHNQEMAAIRRANAERVELGKEMDARLNALMLVVERHISGHQ